MAPDFIKLLGGSIIELDMDSQRAIFTFTVPLDYCHSGDVVQGGFVTAILDAAMSHALFGTDDTISGVAPLLCKSTNLVVLSGSSSITQFSILMSIPYFT